MLKTSKPTQEPAQSGRGGDGRGGEGRGGEGVNKVLQPAQSVRLKASIKVCCRRRVAAVLKTSKPTQEPAQSGRGGDGRGGEGRG